jgi:imidazolonepropionase-like amidohydrolase
MDSTALRAIQAVSNGMQMMSNGFTVVRDLGNNGNYADTALRVAIEQGWIRDRPSSTRASSSAAWAGSSRRPPRWRRTTTSSIPSTSTPTRTTRS